MPSDYGTGSSRSRKRKPKPKYKLKTSAPRGDAPQTRRSDFAKANAYKATSPQYYRDRVAAAKHHPKRVQARQEIKKATTTPQKLAAIDKLRGVRKKQTRRTDKIAQQHYRRHLGRLYSQVEGYFGPTQPRAKFLDDLTERTRGGRLAAGEAAHVGLRQNEVLYDSSVARDYMRARRDARKAAAETIPLHEWVHTRQGAKDWGVPPSTANVEGMAEFGKAYLTDRLGMESAPVSDSYLDYAIRYGKKKGTDALLKRLREGRR